MSAAALEEEINRVLLIIMPGYEQQFLKKEDLKLAHKIRVVRSLKLLPDKLFVFSLLIKDIRNSFAHKFELNSFEKLDNKIIARLNQYHKDDFTKPNSILLKDKFDDIVKATLLGLWEYHRSLKLLRDVTEKYSDFLIFHYLKDGKIDLDRLSKEYS